MEHEELTEKIIGCAYKVYNALGPGFLEAVYEEALMIELRHAGLCAKQQVSAQVEYRGTVVGDFYADIVVNDTVVIELKAVTALAQAHELQLVNYLNALDKPIGLIINFGEFKVDVRRKVRSLEQFKKN